MRNRCRALLAICGLAAITYTGCGGGGGESTSTETIAIDGSIAAFPWARTAAEEFQKVDSAARVTVSQSEKNDGFEELCSGKVQIAAAARGITSAEATACAQRGISPARLEVASDGIAVVANPKLGLRCLSRMQLDRLWRSGSQARSLAELGRDAETGKPLSSTEISLYGPAESSDTHNSFSERVTGSTDGTRGDYVAGSDDATAESIAADDGGVAYMDYESYKDHADDLELIGVDTGDGCLVPSVETIQDGTYFLAQPLLIYANQAESAKSPALARFLRYVAAQNASIAGESGTVALAPVAAARMRDRVRSLTDG